MRDLSSDGRYANWFVARATWDAPANNFSNMAATCHTNGSVGTTKSTRSLATHVYVEMTVLPDDVGAQTTADLPASMWRSTFFCHASKRQLLRKGDSGGRRLYISSSWNDASAPASSFRTFFAARSSLRNSWTRAAPGDLGASFFFLSSPFLSLAFLSSFFFFLSSPADLAAAAASALASATRSFSLSHMMRGSKAVSGARLRSTTGMRDFVSL
mmetsp:Transcript_21928/g.72595  ORF Transcript_21928/g.72595 Transcript_21928/m.72595 type:complete len:214 (-) Transcript_21928:220-861(-)